MKSFNWKEELRRHSLFLTLNESQIERLLRDDVSLERQYPKGTTILREGEWGDSIFLIGSGSVKVVLRREDGGEVVLSILGQGELFGEMAILDRRPRTATVVTYEDCCLLELKGEEFLKLMHEHPAVEFKVLMKLSERLRHANEELFAVKLKDIDGKLSHFKDRLDAELRTIDAGLKAAYAVFEQTNVRADEIIKSAERSRTRLTVVASAAGTILTFVIGAVGWFGFEKFDKINDLAKKADENAAVIRKTRVEVEQSAQVNQSLRDISARLADNVLIPSFEDALAKNIESLAVNLYQDIRELKAKDPRVIKDVLNRIELRIIEQSGRDYTGLLGTILEDARDPEDIIKCRYLLLTNAILVKGLYPSTRLPHGETFDATFDALKAYVEDHKDKKITKDTLAPLEKLFEQQDKQKQEAFSRVKKLVLRPLISIL